MSPRSCFRPLGPYWAILSSLLFGIGCAGQTAAPPQAAARPRIADVPPTTQPPSVGNTPKEKSVHGGQELTRALPDGRVIVVRQALKAFQQSGAQRFISRIRVRPSFDSGHFRGWAILHYGGPGRLLRRDIVTRINGRAIERPEQFMKVWAGLSAANELRIEILRGGKRLVFRWPIESVEP